MINCFSLALRDNYLLNNTFKLIQGEQAVSEKQTVQV